MTDQVDVETDPAIKRIKLDPESHEAQTLEQIFGTTDPIKSELANDKLVSPLDEPMELNSIGDQIDAMTASTNTVSITATNHTPITATNNPPIPLDNDSVSLLKAQNPNSINTLIPTTHTGITNNNNNNFQTDDSKGYQTKNTIPPTNGVSNVTPSTNGVSNVTPSTNGVSNVTPPTNGISNVTSPTNGLSHLAPSTSALSNPILPPSNINSNNTMFNSNNDNNNNNSNNNNNTISSFPTTTPGGFPPLPTTLPTTSSIPHGFTTTQLHNNNRDTKSLSQAPPRVNSTPLSSTAPPTPKISRLVILYDTPKYQHMKTQIEDFKLFPHTSLKVVLLSDLDLLQKDPYDWLNLCIEYNDEFSGNLKKISEFIDTNKEYIKSFKEIGYHFQFDSRKKWPDDYTEFDKDEYSSFINILKSTVADKVVHCSIINKFEINTIYLTNKDDLEKLGHEIQSDIDSWKNLRLFDYGDNCIRFFPGVKFPDTLELMNIGGGYALETLAGFKMPPKLKVLIASHGSITNIDNIQFPSTLETLELVENKLYFINHVEFPMKLEKLDLSNNRIDNLRGIEFPKNLKQLSLSMNPIDSIKGIKFPNHLEYLDISCVPNESMTGVKFPDSLVALNLQESMITTRGLKLPPFLKEVNLGDNGVNSINPLKLPDSIEKLWLTNNNIKTLNKVQFPRTLKELYLGNNMITTLKNVLFPKTLQLLDMEMDPEFDEHDKHLTTLKDVVFPINLKHLNLGYHSIKSVESIEFPYHLETLSLRYNELKVFRNNKFGPYLKKLDLSGNQDLISLDHILLPDALVDLRVPNQLVDKLPGYIIERANSKKLVITKSSPY
ncbi:uncharacterized protein KQ657_001600 [Scheffersomyces spartinae]|uniref:Uncharacterized protein n=1 Tax=Scheffersomyces spartinae TaxID=45513 RepID=A0A9P8AGM1_9ASCO|nr:uncharacterized protein KQ657_001600 [Scheffersomyces spartinae]KAG7192505.1 hypothetical protein KQ657_001600 [Scheffersomyces spartinae]